MLEKIEHGQILWFCLQETSKEMVSAVMSADRTPPWAGTRLVGLLWNWLDLTSTGMLLSLVVYWRVSFGSCIWARSLPGLGTYQADGTGVVTDALLWIFVWRSLHLCLSPTSMHRQCYPCPLQLSMVARRGRHNDVGLRNTECNCLSCRKWQYCPGLAYQQNQAFPCFVVLGACGTPLMPQ